MKRLLQLLALVGALIGCTPLAAHEVRPAYLEITERADGRADVLWKQPSQGQLAIHLTPRLSPHLLDRPADSVRAAPGFEIRSWNGIDLARAGLGNRTVTVEGLDQTITDVLVVIRLKGGDQLQQILTPAAPAFVIDAHSGAAVPAYLFLGVEHILTGIDHLLFVLGLILLSTSLRTLLKTITAFTVAHSITLALTALKLMSVNPALIEAMVAFSILFLAVELVRKFRGETGVTIRTPWLIAFGFGLLHGAAFAGALKQIGLPEGAIPASLFLFNLGVEIGQLMFVAVVMLLFALLGRVRWSPAARYRALTAVTYGIGSFSMFWFLERLQAALFV